MCITVYSPLMQWNAGPGKKVRIIGLGGLGHIRIKIAYALGAEVTVLSHSENKKMKISMLRQTRRPLEG